MTNDNNTPKCNTDCRENMLKCLGKKLDRRFFWTVIGSLVVPSALVVGWLFSTGVRASDNADAIQNKRIEENHREIDEIDDDINEIKANQNLIMYQMSEEIERSKETDKQILEVLKEVQRFQRSHDNGGYPE